MFAAALIVFREVLEAGLILGLVLAATEGVRGRGPWIAAGAAAGLAGATAVAVFAGALSEAFSGAGRDLFDAAILIAAVVMLSWHALWMAGHARAMASEMNALGAAVSAGERTLLAMAVVVAAAILREGSEAVLFLFGLAASGGEGPAQMVGGGFIGVALGAASAFVLYRGLVAIPVRRLFSVTNALIALLAAGMAGQAAVILARVDLVPTLKDQMWDTSGLLRDDGLIGRGLHALVGYSDRPTGVQVLAYVTVLALLLGFGRWLARAPAAAGAR